MRRVPPFERSFLLQAVVPVMVCSAALISSCDDEGDPPDTCTDVSTTVSDAGILFDGGCSRIVLLPRVLLDGVFRGGGDDGPCSVIENELSCPVGESGTVFASLNRSTMSVRFVAAEETVVEGLALEGEARLPDATGWLSNGFQSWSASGVIAIGERRADPSVLASLALRADPETMRTGEELSNWYTFAGSTEGPALFIGASSAEKLRPWFQVTRVDEEDLWVRLACGGAGERIVLQAEEALSSEIFELSLGQDVTTLLERYGRSLPSRRAEVEVDPELGWNSWYELWDTVDEEAVRTNAAGALSILEPVAGSGQNLRIVVDDGWQQAWGEWEPNEKFPSGMDGLASDLAGEGFEMGIWLAPLLVAEQSDLVADHPAWFVADVNFNHVVHGTMRILDPTHPEAAEHLQDVIRRIVSWGYDLLKIDFLFAGTFEGERNEDVTGMEAYHLALALIREAAGEDTLLLAVGAPPLPSFPHVDAWRLGGDIAFDPFGPSWHFVVNQARSLGSRWPLCFATLCDPDPLLLRTLEEEEVGFASWVVSLAGGGLFLSDDLRELPAERRTWGLDDPRYRAAMSGAPSIPADLFPEEPPFSLAGALSDFLAHENTHVLPTRWTTPEGRTVILNLTDEALELDGSVVPARGAQQLDAP